MKIFLGTDHAGYAFKEVIKAYLLGKEYDVVDCGATAFDKQDDYPDFVIPAAEGVVKTSGAMGIVFGKSGAGECLAANKVRGIRAFLGVSEENVRLARQHNDANVLSLGSALVSEEQAKKLVDLFLTTPFSNEERHVRRIEKIKHYEDGL